MIVSGIVEKGRGEAGPVYGLPTANIRVGAWFRPGIYAGKVTIDAGVFNAIVYYGMIDGLLEAHLFDFSGDLLGQTITVEIGSKVDDYEPFVSVQIMREKIEKDIKKVKVCLQE